jgi:hypothetical protein
LDADTCKAAQKERDRRMREMNTANEIQVRTETARRRRQNPLVLCRLFHVVDGFSAPKRKIKRSKLGLASENYRRVGMAVNIAVSTAMLPAEIMEIFPICNR